MTPSAPGVTVERVQGSTPRGAIINTGTMFAAGFAERGLTTAAVEVRSLADFVATFGDRVAYSYLYDAVDVFFQEGGTVAQIARLLGPTPVKASAELLDQSGSATPADVALVATAKQYGDFWNGLNVVVDYDAGNFTITVSHDTDTTISETSGALADRAAAVAWESEYLDITLGASNEDPRDGSYALASGDDDHANVTTTEYEEALALFTRDLGPGQVYIPGAITSAIHTAVAEHAEAMKRVAICDATDTATVATLTTLADANDGGDLGSYIKLCAPWVTGPGPETAPTSDRTIPWGAIECGMSARNDSAGLPCNQPAAGVNGISRWATGLTQTWSEADRATLNDAGVNVAREIYGTIRGYGNRSLADPTTQAALLPFGGQRESMLIDAQAEEVGEKYAHLQVSGRKVELKDYQAELAALCKKRWELGALYGETPEEAFRVDTGDTVNTDVTLAAGELRAQIAIRTSPAPERVVIRKAHLPITTAV